MQWYMIKTWIGREEELVREIHRTVPPAYYHECFIIRQERLWRRQQSSILHTEPLLPGCVFITCREPGTLLARLAQIPLMARRIACGDVTLLPLMPEDADFLETLSGSGRLVRLSYIDKDMDGTVTGVAGPLRIFGDHIDRYQFKKRFAVARHTFLGEERAFSLGIALKEDLRQNGICPGLPAGVIYPERIARERSMQA